MQPSFLIEQNFANYTVAGVDEAGRGPLAGPVVASCALLNQDNWISGINDSKKLTKKQRQEIFIKIKEKVRYGIGIVDEKVIDEINILQATKLAMLRSYDDFVRKYNFSPQVVIVDGNFTPFVKSDLFTAQIVESLAVIKGDQKSLSIACASIIAKESRDEIMLDFHHQYPQYGFDKHAGYGTKMHLEKIKEFGVLPIHRKTFAPIKIFFN
jgi:ribonuclease HII